MSIAKRLDKLEATYASQALVLPLADGRKAILPQAADLDVFFGFMMLVNEGELAWRGQEIPGEWIQVLARSIPQPGEGTITEACRELCRSYLNGEDLRG